MAQLLGALIFSNHIWFSASTSGGLQLPGTPSPQGSDALSWPQRAPTVTCIHTQIVVCIYS